MITTNLEKYDSYSESNVEWLGSIPSHWAVTRNKDIFKERGVLSQSGEETLLTVSHITGVTKRSEKNVNMFMAESHEGYKIVEKGDLVINTMWAWMGALGTSNENGICSPAYGVYMPKDNSIYDRRYFDYLYRTPNAIAEMTRYSKGIVSSRLRLYPKDFFQIQTALPPKDEQVKIADYIDSKIASIDFNIQLLEIKRTSYLELGQSIIDSSVIKDIYSNIISTYNNITGARQLLKNWKGYRLKEIGYLYSGLTGKKGDDFTDEHENSEPFVTFTNIANNFSLSINQSKSVIISPNEKQNYVRTNDLFFLMSSEDYKDIGKCSILRRKMNKKTYLNSFCKGFRITDNNVYPAFIAYLLRSSPHRTKLMIEGKGFTRINLKIEKINNIEIVIPILEEQKLIVSYLDENLRIIDEINNTVTAEINLLKESRISIINEACTGSLRAGANLNKGIPL